MKTMPTPDSANDKPNGSVLPERFASVVAHELRNPLSAVKIALQTIGHHQALPAKDATRQGIALREVGTIERVLDLILEWARPSDLLVEEAAITDVLRLISTLSADVLDERGVTLDIAIDDSASKVHVDIVRLACAVSELIRNAALASPSNAAVRLQYRRAANTFVFVVSDEGTGLDSESLAHAFEPYWSKNARGVGLGLTVARDVAQRHGGALVLENNPEKGCVARLSFADGKSTST